MRLAAISVDLDEVPCYTAIHGLPIPEGRKSAIYDAALPRLAKLFEEEHVPATFFVIGRDATGPNIERLGALRDAGHELANHTLNHRYDLTRLPIEAMRQEVEGGQRAIEAICGEAPVGFRAPGYTINDRLLRVLSEQGLNYDSSVFPCPAYYGAKVAAISAIALAGRRSHSVIDDPRVLRSPANPYRVDSPYWRRGEGLLELPIGVTRGARLPYIGTSVVLSSPIGARLLTKMMLGRPLINLELHGIDLSDANEDGLQFLRPHQPDLRRSAMQKAASLRAALRTLRVGGYEFVTLAEAARRVDKREQK